MGACESRVVRQARKTNIIIEKQLASEEKKKTDEIKLIILGTSGCGKSTILKQMRIIHKNGFSQSELELMKTSVYYFVLDSMLKVICAMGSYGHSLENSNNELLVAGLRKASAEEYDSDYMALVIIPMLKTLWTDNSIKEMAVKGHSHNLNGSTLYFMDNLERIGDKDYVPSEQDLLYLSTKTTGVVELELTFGKNILRVVDVGGQKSERRKWIHCFDVVSVVMFVAALNDYCHSTVNDYETNEHRMTDSLQTFEYICGHASFSKASIILFLNKKDLFEKALKTTPLKAFFTNYTGPNDYTSALKYVRKQFLRQNRVQTRLIYVHETCAIDTRQTKYVLDDCFTIVFKEAVENMGCL